MNIKIFIGLLVLIIAAAGLVFWWQQEETRSDPIEEDTSMAPVETEPVDMNGTGTLASLVARGENLECTVSYTPLNADSEIMGSYFVANGNVRGDFVHQSADLGEVVTSYINDGTSIYLWSDINGESYGVVTSLDQQQLIATQEPIPADARVRYQCQPWQVVDNSIFEPPSGILFKEAVQADMEYGTVYEEGEFPF